MIPKEYICTCCKGDLRIRNPTGNCDHLYYPDNVNKNFNSPNSRKEITTKAILGSPSGDAFLNKYLRFKEVCIKNKVLDIDEIIKLFEVWIQS